LLDWYFWHQQEDSSAEMRDLLQGTLTSLQEAYHDAPEFVKNHHMHSMEFWERYSKKTTDAAQKKCGDHYGSVTMNSNIAEMMEGGDRSLHIGNERVRDEVRMGFEEYLRQKQKVPLMYPLQLMQLANEGQQGHSRQELKNYYDTLGVPLIPPHSGFEVGTYAGPGATPWIWRHFNIRLLGSHEHVSVPFRRHQIIKLASDIIGRQLDVQRLVELGYVKCLFPLDSRDKVEVPVDWVNTSDEEAGNKFWFNLQSGEVSWDKPRSSSLRAHELYELPRTPQGASREKQDPAGEQGFSEVGQSQCPSEQVSSEVARSALEQGSSEVARSASEAPEAEDDLISSVRSESDLRLPSELLQSWGFPIHTFHCCKNSEYFARPSCGRLASTLFGTTMVRKLPCTLPWHTTCAGGAWYQQELALYQEPCFRPIHLIKDTRVLHWPFVCSMVLLFPAGVPCGSRLGNATRP